jgi:very-short-patch-repair endonuclease
MERGRGIHFVKRELVARAREFRTVPTRSEAMLWGAVRDRQLGGVKFRRQFVIGAFIVDFCAPRERRIIEVDGNIHDTQQEQDTERQRLLEVVGYRMIRVSAEDVETHLPTILSNIANYLPSPSPSPVGSIRTTGLGAMERGPGGEE